MNKDVLPFEYAEESIRNLTILIKSLGTILSDRELIQQAFYTEMLEKHVGQPTDFKFPGIPSVCLNCGRKSFLRIGDTRKCNYCNGNLHMNIADLSMDEYLMTLDASKLFAYRVQASDISDEYAEEQVMLPEMYPNEYWHEYNSIHGYEHQGSGYPGYQDTAQDMVDRFNQDRQIYALEEAQRLVEKYQRPVTRLCQVMEATWHALADQKSEAASRIVSEYLAIDDNKIHRKYDALYKPILCPKCMTSQNRSSLFSVTCRSCSELIVVDVLPGLLVSDATIMDCDAAFSPKQRKLEHLFTLFEALFGCANLAFGLTLKDFSLQVDRIRVLEEQEYDNRVCSFCHRPLKLNQFTKSQCLYCGKVQTSGFLDAYL